MNRLEHPSENIYASDPTIDRIAEKLVTAIRRAGEREPDFGDLQVDKMRKMATLAMRADPNNAEPRFRPGNRLRTYTGVRDEEGGLKDETYGGEAVVKEGSTIYRNADPLKYSDDFPDAEKRGLPIRGHFETDGTFIEEPEGEILYNEYATDNPEHPRKKYGIDPKPGVWTEGLAQTPSYLMQIPAEKEEFDVIADGKRISVRGGDFIVVDALGGGKTGVQGIEKGSKERTYRPWSE